MFVQGTIADLLGEEHNEGEDDGVAGGGGGIRITCHPTMQPVRRNQIPAGAGYSGGCWPAQVLFP